MDDFYLHRKAYLSLAAPPSVITPSTGGVKERSLEVGSCHDESYSLDDGSMIARTQTTSAGGIHSTSAFPPNLKKEAHRQRKGGREGKRSRGSVIDFIPLGVKLIHVRMTVIA